jgi:hypothetical protein
VRRSRSSASMHWRPTEPVRDIHRRREPDVELHKSRALLHFHSSMLPWSTGASRSRYSSGQEKNSTSQKELRFHQPFFSIQPRKTGPFYRHAAGNFIDTCGSASPALRITAFCVYQFWQYSAHHPLVISLRPGGLRKGGIPRSRSTGSHIPPRFSFPANSTDPKAVDISSP